jgi:membrane protease YdiL (CAAX protease family)
MLLLGAIAFAVLNAWMEELIWRGVFQTTLARVWGVPTAIGLQAVSFGVQHAHGFPRGAMGVVLAGSWAAMLGALRVHTRGLRAPVIAHVVADATIAVTVLVVAKG